MALCKRKAKDVIYDRILPTFGNDLLKKSMLYQILLRRHTVVHCKRKAEHINTNNITTHR
jgi:hypothetical protein